MTENPQRITVLTQCNDVLPLVDAIRKAADSDKVALGFFPKSLYGEYATKGNVFAAVSTRGSERELAGYLLFDLRQPRAKVLQIYVVKDFRGLGIGAKLIGHLKQYLTALQYLSIEARVAEDLANSNAFWEREGFQVQRIEAGGRSRGKHPRMIVVRNHELASPQLFSPSGIDSANPLGFSFTPGTTIPTYLLDMNVLFDLGPRRQRRDDVVNLFRAERMQVCSLAISSEIQAELKRHCPAGKTDPMQDLASTLPTYNVPSDRDASPIVSELGEIVFPERARLNQLTPNDKSDLQHLATAIAHKLEGLVTSDSSILNAAGSLRERYSLDVLSPSAFSLEETHPIGINASGSETDRLLELREARSDDENEIRNLLAAWGVSNAEIQGDWAAVDARNRSCVRFVVHESGKLAGYFVRHHTIEHAHINALMAVDERSPCALDCTRLILSELNDHIKNDQISLVRIKFPPAQTLIREEAISIGFTADLDRRSQLQKIVIKRIVDHKNWATTNQSLAEICGIRLPPTSPDFRDANQHIEIHAADGNRTHMPLIRFESMVAPGLFCLPGRGGLITPLQKRFSEHLVPHSPQVSLLPRTRVQLYQQRHYVSHPRNLPKFLPGSLLFIYESQKHGGLGAVVAVARVVRAYLQDLDTMGPEELSPSVFESSQLDIIGKTNTRTVTVFDNLNILPKPVFRHTLEALGCGAPVKLLSTQTINSHQVEGLLAEACR
ncbi:GNAT family N-acetyltransferase [Paraburkholderia sp. Ac-20347]|uniref:GNAT family N-acetyltransferase n=1 Tax=Paraburkholderia sp. Ac-20347 TaxID=2703892 RepID=UPI001980C1CA|nr:GNAT family N-acetyltransferase [Paraburkholderia sp. Ac-20347]MBN3814065.1 GNAT family N-acetyltransferase [Paraburkholderia sp. Ac-20347]